MKIDAGLDTGDMLLERREPIRDDDTTENLSERLSVIGADLMIETLRKLERGEVTPRPQNSDLATLARGSRKKTAGSTGRGRRKNLLGAFAGSLPWPGAYTSFRGKHLHVWRAEAVPAAGGSRACSRHHFNRGRTACRGLR